MPKNTPNPKYLLKKHIYVFLLQKQLEQRDWRRRFDIKTMTQKVDNAPYALRMYDQPGSQG